MTDPRWKPRWGAGAGLGLAAIVFGVVKATPGDDSAWQGILQFLVAIPPFWSRSLLNAPEPMQWALFFVWWGSLGYLVAWGLERGFRKRTVTLLLVALLAVAHVQLKLAIERDIDRAGDATVRIFEHLLGKDDAAKIISMGKE